MMLVDFPIVQRTWGRESLGFSSTCSVFGGSESTWWQCVGNISSNSIANELGEEIRSSVYVGLRSGGVFFCL